MGSILSQNMGGGESGSSIEAKKWSVWNEFMSKKNSLSGSENFFEWFFSALGKMCDESRKNKKIKCKKSENERESKTKKKFRGEIFFWS